MTTRIAAVAKRLLLGPPGRQSLRVSQTVLALAVFAVFAVVQSAEVKAGLLDAAASWWLTAFNLSGALVFYGLIRSGLNEKISTEPSLTLPQMLFAMLSVAAAYSITGPARGAVMSIMMLILLFGMFVLDARTAKRLSALGFALLGAVMLWKAQTDPVRYDPRVEAVHLLFAGIVMAAVAALAIRLSRLRQRLSDQKAELSEALERIRALATRDALTGLLNRRAMMDELVREARRMTRGGRSMALVLLDLDHFKRINDTLGHRVGDRVLQAFAEVALAELRGADRVSRWGGEEFLLLMPQAPQGQAEVAVERIRVLLREAAIDGMPEDMVVTFSAGITLCGSEHDIAAAIDRADLAMYRAKTGGRNRTVFSMACPEAPSLDSAAQQALTA